LGQKVAGGRLRAEVRGYTKGTRQGETHGKRPTKEEIKRTRGLNMGETKGSWWNLEQGIAGNGTK